MTKKERACHFQGTKREDIQKQKCDKILCIWWHDKKEVHLLTTVHKGEMGVAGKTSWRTNQEIMKPDVVNDYNKNMRLDKADMQITSVDCLSKTRKWTRKLVFHLTDACLLNSYMYVVKKGERSLVHMFSKTVMTQLLERYGEPRSTESCPV